MSDSFTRLSSFQYMIDGIPQDFFESLSDNIGILVFPKGNRPVYFRDSDYTTVSSDIFETPQESLVLFKKASSENKFIVCTEQDVCDIVINGSENGRGSFTGWNRWMARYEAENINVDETCLMFTEGLFRYKKEDISGIVVNRGDSKSVQAAKLFSEVINCMLFYRYCDETKKFISFEMV